VVYHFEFSICMASLNLDLELKVVFITLFHTVSYVSIYVYVYMYFIKNTDLNYHSKSLFYNNNGNILIRNLQWYLLPFSHRKLYIRIYIYMWLCICMFMYIYSTLKKIHFNHHSKSPIFNKNGYFCHESHIYLYTHTG
jgi:hypothetical protein